MPFEIIQVREHAPRLIGRGKLRTNTGGANTPVFFGRCNSPRLQPDARGNVIPDCGFYWA